MDDIKNIVKFLAEEDEEEFVFSDVEHPDPGPNAFETWRTKYKPIKNRLDPNAAYDGEMFETFGAEFAIAQAADPHYVWTLVTGDSNETVLTAGYHFVNRIGYFITLLPWTDETESIEFGDGDPENVEQIAYKIVDEELGPDWKTEWNNFTPEEKIEKARSMLEDYGLENLDSQEVVAVVNRLAT